jgi:hypothetical protein
LMFLGFKVSKFLGFEVSRNHDSRFSMYFSFESSDFHSFAVFKKTRFQDYEIFRFQGIFCLEVSRNLNFPVLSF